MTHVIALAATLCALPTASEAQVPDPTACPPNLEVLVERAFAVSAGLEPGDELRVTPDLDQEPCVARVVGLFNPPPDPSRLMVERPRVLFHLPQLSALTDRIYPA